MLHDHPITSFLYYNGYNGIQDIYDYWKQHKQELQALFYKHNPDEESKQALEEFEQIIRWHSIYGLFFRFEVTKEYSKAFGTPKPIDQLSITTGGITLSIKDYSTQTQLFPMTDTRSDLRGFSIVGKAIHDVTIENINFDYGYFDFTTFDQVTFRNCSFSHSTFRQSRLLDCIFDKDCILQENDFSNAVLYSTFDCSITRPIIKPMKLWFITNSNAMYQYKYPNFTILLSDSFIHQTDDDSITNEYQNQSHLRHRILSQLKRPH